MKFFITFGFLFTALMASAQSLGEIGETSIPSNCKRWFDGCNFCSREQPGAYPTCTQKACHLFDVETQLPLPAQQQKQLFIEDSYCEAFFSAEEGVPHVVGPNTLPGENFIGPSGPPPLSYTSVEIESTQAYWLKYIDDWLQYIDEWLEYFYYNKFVVLVKFLSKIF